MPTDDDVRDPLDVRQALELLNARCGWDCVITAFDGWRLKLSSGTSETSVSPLAEFCGVSYLSCPTSFSHARFREADAAQARIIGSLVPVESTDHVFAIEAETMAGMEPHVFFVVAEFLEFPQS